MRNTSGNTVRVEAWSVQGERPTTRKVVSKVAVRDSAGRFLPATNYRGSVIG